MAVAVQLKYGHSLGPIFIFGVHLEDVGTGFRVKAPAKPSIGFSRHRIGDDLVGERELIFRIPARNMLAMGSSRLRESIVHENAVAATNPVEHAVENAVAFFVFVKAKPQEIVHGTARLRRTKGVDELQISGQRIRVALIIRGPHGAEMLRHRVWRRTPDPPPADSSPDM